MNKDFSQNKPGNKVKKSKSVKTPTSPVGEIVSAPIVNKAKDAVPEAERVQNAADKSKTNFIQKSKNFIESIPKWAYVVAVVVGGLATFWNDINSGCTANVTKKSLIPIVNIDTNNKSLNMSVDVTKPTISIKNFGNSIVKDVKISLRAELRYNDIPEDKVSTYALIDEKLGNIFPGKTREYSFSVPSDLQEKIAITDKIDTRLLFLHIKITFDAFDTFIENPRVGVKFIRDGQNTRYEDCEHNE